MASVPTSAGSAADAHEVKLWLDVDRAANSSPGIELYQQQQQQGHQQQGQQQQQQGQRRVAGPGLSDILTPEALGPLLRTEDVRSRLLEYLPEEHRSSQDLEELVSTPQFKSQLERFSHALQSGQMDLAQFGLNPGTGFSVAEFLQAIQTQVESTAGDAKDGENKEGDDAMKE
eukprot:CAMPEP_0197575694 /NCGR_PEP_ID=MMETSP1326-20131121/1003_1 /TAXON_ID=1155430 /ORGANISM="Genus nov. species nov., Strain RCC2288" /LENGTH=172 /DNA_ID=CAMNT_0043138505 /DNA_START=402 /DNA_END=920 /DNA_ORIENTATION=-